MRIGYGYDVHRFDKNSRLILGGVEIDCELGLEGHSDADVLVHAVIDALVGACALGDIGTFFPDSDCKYKGADSLKLLKEIVMLINSQNYKINNIDSTIVAQTPRLQPHIKKMRENIARICSIPVDCVSVKATTEEKLGFTGALQGISSHAVCTVI